MNSTDWDMNAPLTMDMGEIYSQLYFYFGTQVKFIFKGCETQNAGTYSLVLVLTFLMALSIEGLNFLRYHLQASAYSKLN